MPRDRLTLSGLQSAVLDSLNLVGADAHILSHLETVRRQAAHAFTAR